MFPTNENHCNPDRDVLFDVFPQTQLGLVSVCLGLLCFFLHLTLWPCEGFTGEFKQNPLQCEDWRHVVCCGGSSVTGRSVSLRGLNETTSSALWTSSMTTCVLVNRCWLCLYISSAVADIRYSVSILSQCSASAEMEQ